jgi:polar amino acid transport system permease protein
MDFVDQLVTAIAVIATRGLPNTIFLSASAYAFGLCLGLLFAFIQVLVKGPAGRAVDAVVTVLRGIPPVLLLFMIFYGLPALGVRLNNVISAIIGLGLISGAYQSQVLRSSIEAVSARQLEAALSIGLDSWGAFSSIIFPQAIRLSLPGLVNEFTILLKDTSLAYSIGVVEMFTQAVHIAQARFEYVAPLSAVAILYLVTCFSISQSVNVLYGKLRVPGYGV